MLSCRQKLVVHKEKAVKNGSYIFLFYIRRLFLLVGKTYLVKYRCQQYSLLPYMIVSSNVPFVLSVSRETNSSRLLMYRLKYRNRLPVCICEIIRLLLLRTNAVGEHIPLEWFWNPDAAICIQVVFQECDQHSRRCHNGIVQRMRKVLAAVSCFDPNA